MYELWLDWYVILRLIKVLGCLKFMVRQMRSTVVLGLPHGHYGHKYVLTELRHHIRLI